MDTTSILVRRAEERHTERRSPCEDTEVPGTAM